MNKKEILNWITERWEETLEDKETETRIDAFDKGFWQGVFVTLTELKMFVNKPQKEPKEKETWNGYNVKDMRLSKGSDNE